MEIRVGSVRWGRLVAQIRPAAQLGEGGADRGACWCLMGEEGGQLRCPFCHLGLPSSQIFSFPSIPPSLPAAD